MLKRELAQLAIYQIDREIEILPIECLHDLYLEKTSEIIYITKNDILYGMVSLGDLLHHSTETGVQINRVYTALNSYNVIKAHKIFKTKLNINKIPIVNAQGKLLGDYSRWDDMLYIERNQELLMQKEIVQRILKAYQTVYVIEPTESNKSYYYQLIDYLRQFEIQYIILNKKQISERQLENNLCIFLNEDERRGVQCLYRVDIDKYGIIIHSHDISAAGGRFITWKGLLLQVMCEIELGNLSIKKIENLSYDGIDEKTTLLLRMLEKKGIKSFNLFYDEKEPTEYCKKFLDAVHERLKKFPIRDEAPWPQKSENADFFGELYQCKDYEEEIAQKEIYQSSRTFEYKKNISGKYFNSKEGRRITSFQPKEYTGTIYLFGPCTIVGVLVEDQYTIASYLQKKLLEHGYCYRVQNYGTLLRHDAAMDKCMQSIDKFYSNDIVVAMSGSEEGEPVDVEKNSLRNVFDRYQIPNEWVTDTFFHCNHKANNLIADSMLEMIEPYLKDKKKEEQREINISVQDVMRDFVKGKYLDLFFSHFPSSQYRSIGAIVMNCNPFSRGHRYLIERARKQVEFLIIFAVEEDSSLFPFEERFTMIEEGIKDLGNVMVVPSGRFILSLNNFPEYFSKTKDEIIYLNAEYDIELFADYIAKPLHITHRFAGEEPEDEVTRIYNEAMKKILPNKGIAFIEIPRTSIENEIVSASRARKYLETEQYEKAFSLLPETTRRYLKNQIETNICMDEGSIV